MCYCCCKCGLATCPADLPFSSGVHTESLELGSFGASGGDSPMGRRHERFRFLAVVNDTGLDFKTYNAPLSMQCVLTQSVLMGQLGWSEIHRGRHF